MNVSNLRRFVFPLFCSLFFVFSSVSAFAYNSSFNLNNGLPSSILIDDEDNTIIGTLITSTMYTDSKQYLRDWFSGVSSDGDSNYHYYLYGSLNKQKKGYLRFVRCPFNVSCSLSSSRETFHTPIGTEYLSFDFDGDNGFRPCYSSVGKVNVNSSVTISPKDEYFLVPFNEEVGENIEGVYKGALAFVDDDGLLGDRPDKPKPPPVEPPKTPQGDPKYVPYDTGVWDGFYSSTTSSIGAITTIIFKLLALIYGILIILSIVRAFVPGAKKTKGNGGSGSPYAGRAVKSVEYTYYD